VVEAKLHEELDTVLDGRPPAPDDLDALEYTRYVVTESLRIDPSVPAFFRGIRGDGLRLGDETVPSGSLLGFSPWTIQRDARWWPDPLRFDPDRWGAGRERPPHFAYFPSRLDRIAVPAPPSR
jgi:cytochrome P450